jgi:hypothetical protein
LGVLQRTGEIKTAKDVLRRAFLYLTEGKSFGNTWALLHMSEGYHLTKQAIYTRIGKSAVGLEESAG